MAEVSSALEKALGNLRKRQPYANEDEVASLKGLVDTFREVYSPEDVKMALSSKVQDVSLPLLSLFEGREPGDQRRTLFESSKPLTDLAVQLAHVNLAINAFEPFFDVERPIDEAEQPTLLDWLVCRNAPQLSRARAGAYSYYTTCSDKPERSQEMWVEMCEQGRVNVNGKPVFKPNETKLDQPHNEIEFLGSSNGSLLEAITAQLGSAHEARATGGLRADSSCSALPGTSGTDAQEGAHDAGIDYGEIAADIAADNMAAHIAAATDFGGASCAAAAVTTGGHASPGRAQQTAQEEALRQKLAARIADWLNVNEKTEVGGLKIPDYVAWPQHEPRSWPDLVETIRQGGGRGKMSYDWVILFAAVEILERPALVYSAKYNVAMRLLPSTFNKIEELHREMPTEFVPAGHLSPSESWIRLALLDGSHFVPIKGTSVLLQDVLTALDYSQSKMEDANTMSGEKKDAVMVVGGTGAGKSTLMHVLKGIPLALYKRKLDGKVFLTPTNPEQMLTGSKIGATLKSETKHVNILNCHDESPRHLSNLQIIDTPGFLDTTPEDEIVNAVTISKTMVNCKTLRVIFLFRESTLYDGKSQGFLQELTTLATLFKDFSKASQSLLLWCSQPTGNHTEDEVKGRFKMITAAQTNAKLAEITKELVNIAQVSTVTFVSYEIEGAAVAEKEKIVRALVDHSRPASERLLADLKVLRDSEGNAFKVKYEDYNFFGDTGATAVAVDGSESDDDEEYVKTAAFLHADGGKDSVAKLLGFIGARRRNRPEGCDIQFKFENSNQINETIELLSEAIEPRQERQSQSTPIPVNFRRDDLMRTIASRQALGHDGVEPKRYCNMPLSASGQQFLSILCAELKKLIVTKCKADDFKAVAHGLDAFARIIVHFRTNDNMGNLTLESDNAKRAVREHLMTEIGHAANAFLNDLHMDKSSNTVICEPLLHPFLRAIRCGRAVAAELGSLMVGIPSPDDLIRRLHDSVRELTRAAKAKAIDAIELKTALVKLQQLRELFDASSVIAECASELETFIIDAADKIRGELPILINDQKPDEAATLLLQLQQGEMQLGARVPELGGKYADSMGVVCRILKEKTTLIQKLCSPCERNPGCIKRSTEPKLSKQGSRGAIPLAVKSSEQLEELIYFLFTISSSYKLQEHYLPPRVPLSWHPPLTVDGLATKEAGEASSEAHATAVVVTSSGNIPLPPHPGLPDAPAELASASPNDFYEIACEAVHTWHEEVANTVKGELLDNEAFVSGIAARREPMETLKALKSLRLSESTATKCRDEYSDVSSKMHQMLCSFARAAELDVEDLDSSPRDYAYQKKHVDVLIDALWWDKLSAVAVSSTPSCGDGGGEEKKSDDVVANALKKLWVKFKERAQLLAESVVQAFQNAAEAMAEERTCQLDIAKSDLEKLHKMLPLWEERLAQPLTGESAGVEKVVMDGCKELKLKHDQTIEIARKSLSTYLKRARDEALKGGPETRLPFCTQVPPRINEDVKAAMRAIDALLDVVQKFQRLDFLGEMTELRAAKKECLEAVKSEFEAMSFRVRKVVEGMNKELKSDFESALMRAPPEEIAAVMKLLCSSRDYPALFSEMAKANGEEENLHYTYRKLEEKMKIEKKRLDSRFGTLDDIEFKSRIVEIIGEIARDIPDKEPFKKIKEDYETQAYNLETHFYKDIKSDVLGMMTFINDHNFYEVAERIMGLRTTRPGEYDKLCTRLNAEVCGIVSRLHISMGRMQDHLRSPNNGFDVKEDIVTPFAKLNDVLASTALTTCIRDYSATRGKYPVGKLPPSTQDELAEYETCVRAGGPNLDQPDTAILPVAQPPASSATAEEQAPPADIEDEDELKAPSYVKKGANKQFPINLKAEIEFLNSTFAATLKIMIKPLTTDFRSKRYLASTTAYQNLISMLQQIKDPELDDIVRKALAHHQKAMRVHLMELKQVGKERDIYDVDEVLGLSPRDKMDDHDGITWFNEMNQRLEALVSMTSSDYPDKKLFQEAAKATVDAVKQAVNDTFSWHIQKKVKDTNTLKLLLQTVRRNFMPEGSDLAAKMRFLLQLDQAIDNATQIIKAIEDQQKAHEKTFELKSPEEKARYINDQQLPPGPMLNELLQKYQQGYAAAVQSALCLLKEAPGPPGELSKAYLTVRGYIDNDGFIVDGGEKVEKVILETAGAQEMTENLVQRASKLHATIVHDLDAELTLGPVVADSEELLLTHFTRFVDMVRIAAHTSDGLAAHIAASTASADWVAMETASNSIREWGSDVLKRATDQYDLLNKTYMCELKTKSDCTRKLHALNVLAQRDGRPGQDGLTARVVELEAVLAARARLRVVATGKQLELAALATQLSDRRTRADNVAQMIKQEITKLIAEIARPYDANADPAPLTATKYELILSSEMKELMEEALNNKGRSERQSLEAAIKEKALSSMFNFNQGMKEGTDGGFAKAAEQVAYLNHLGALLDLEHFAELKASSVDRTTVLEQSIRSIEANARNELDKVATVPIPGHASLCGKADVIAPFIIQLRVLEETIPSAGQQVAKAIMELLMAVKKKGFARSHGTDALADALLQLDEVRGKAVIELYPQVFTTMLIKFHNDRPKITLQTCIENFMVMDSRKLHSPADAMSAAASTSAPITARPEKIVPGTILDKYKEFLEHYQGKLGRPVLEDEGAQTGWLKSIDPKLSANSPRNGILTKTLARTCSQIPRALEEIRDQVKKHCARRTFAGSRALGNFASWVGGEGLTVKDQEVVPEVLAGIFAYWAVQHFLESYDPSQPHDEVPIRKPNATQVLCILRLLGCATGSSKKFVLKNHLAQVPTGEGKSVVIAATAATLALFGYRVDCICYSDSLSKRDYADFKKLFEGLGLEDKITYGTFESLAESLVVENHGDVRKQVEAYICTGKHTQVRAQSQGERVLIIDEVDTFLSPTLFGAPYRMTKQVNHPTIAALQRAIWNEPKKENYSDQVEAVIAAGIVAKSQQWFLISAVRQMQAAVLAHKEKKRLRGTDYELGKDDNEGWIAYKVHDRFLRSDRFNYRYATNCTYLEEALVAKSIREADLLDHGLPMYLICGEFAYSLMPTTKPYVGSSAYPPVLPFYTHVLGVTGTLDEEKLPPGSQGVLANEFGIDQFTFLPSMYPVDMSGTSGNLVWAPGAHTKLVSDTPNHHLTIAGDIIDKLGSPPKRAVLVFFETREGLQAFYDSDACKTNIQTVAKKVRCLTEVIANDKDREREKSVCIQQATIKGHVTLCTRSYGRGVDFRVADTTVLENGGVHVVSTFFPDDVSEEVQMKGRCARQGDKGSFSMVLNAEDLTKFDSEKVNETRLKEWASTQTVYAKLHEVRTVRGLDEVRERLKKADAVKREHQQLIKNLEVPEKFATFVKANNDVPVKVSSRTILALDATLSMEKLLCMTKTQITELFKRVSKVLQEENITSGFEMQIVAYRNYDAPIEDILERSDWATMPDDLQSFLTKLQAAYGWGDEAVEMAFLHAENENKHGEGINQIILIGDAPAQSTQEAAKKRASKHGEVYWSDKKLPTAGEPQPEIGPPMSAEDVLKRMMDAGARVPVHAYYIDMRAKRSFVSLAQATGGTHGFLDIHRQGGAENLIGLICTQILESLGGKSARASYEKMFSKPSFS